jgi:methyl-accepting chemotaxis protein
MNKSFLVLFLTSLCGVLATSFFDAGRNDLQWLGVVFGFIPLIIYHYILSKKNLLSSAEIDSIYYFGFLVTVVTLVSTAISIGMAATLPEVKWILRQFGLGLVATGYALFARIWLMGKSSDAVEMDVVEATTKLVGSIRNVSNQFDEAGYDSVEFVKTLKLRLEDLLNEADKRLSDNLKNTIESISEANQEIVNNSISKTSEMLDRATNKFSESISLVMEEVIRIHTEAQAINFEKASEKLSSFSKEIESSFGSIAEKSIEASEDAAKGIGELTATVRKTQKLAVEIGAKLASFNEVAILLQSVSGTVESVKELDQAISSSNKSLNEFSTRSALASVALNNEVIEPLASLNINQSLKDVTSNITNGSNHLNKSFEEISDATKKLSTAFNENIRLLEEMRGGVDQSKLIASGITTLGAEIETLKTEFSDLNGSIKELKNSIASLNKIAEQETQSEVV